METVKTYGLNSEKYISNQLMLIRPCKPWVRGALRWCTAKRKKREIICYELTRMLYGLMGWNQESHGDVCS